MVTHGSKLKVSHGYKTDLSQTKQQKKIKLNNSIMLRKHVSHRRHSNTLLLPLLTVDLNLFTRCRISETPIFYCHP